MEFRQVKEMVYIPYKQNGHLKEMQDNGKFGDMVEVALISTEVSKALEVLREKIVDEHHLAEECADIFIRLANFCNRKNIDLEKAIIEKNYYNSKRDYKHGKDV